MLGESFIKGLSTSILVLNGRIDDAYQSSEESLQLAKKMDDIYVNGMAYCCYGASCFHKGIMDKAEKYLLESVTCCKKTTHITWGAWAMSLLGEIYFYKKEYKNSENYYSQAISFLESCSFSPSLVNNEKLAIVRTRVLNGDKDINLTDLFQYYENNKIGIYKGHKARYIGEILLNLDGQPLSEATDWICRAIEIHKNDNMRWFLADDYALCSKLCRRKGNLTKAKENLNKAIDIFKECGADGWVQKYEKEFAALQ